ncbi:gliding motility-associated C-terminal domain-containing protein [Algoriphagus faecimaris]|uniref:Gliding motility-associated C-terminal domain-containing protein n=1 Tax=Algoriphagus faecimaris TaxID=686796 RepID=A0A1G6RQZ1_9BACT|nr:PKD domain-containing protein [Algoriphagus faecimaris]SDD06366.1 gliding motility-associated C-terminal domain-containing protein [Algoriphagus faecimaris]
MIRVLGVVVGFILFFGMSADGYAQLSTVGREFWVGFMENNRIAPGPNTNGAPDFAVIIITADEDATGAIEYQGETASFNLNAGQQYTLRIPTDQLDLLHRRSGVTENKGVYISSSGKIAVHAYNERFRSADGTVILPVGALGTDYYVTSHYELLTANVNYNANSNDESTLLVVATEDQTQVEINTTVPTQGGAQANTPFTITLNRGQSYQLKAKDDLTGTRVRVVGANVDECKRIAVFGGNKWTSVGDCGEANDHLFQQAYPVTTWGTSFVHVALSGRTSGELVKVLAAEDGTEVRVNGDLQGSVNQGEWLPLEFGINQSGKIETSKPASVTVFSKSQACNQPNSPNAFTGDPFMITYSPSEQFLKTLTFNSLDLPSIENHYVNIVIKAGTENLTVLDGQVIATQFQVLPGDANFLYARVNISRGVHRLSNPEGFAAYAYGFGNLESYGYAAGAALDNLNFQTEAEYDFDVVGENVACLNVPGDWVIEPDNPDFTYFVWDFGDGSAREEGKSVSHTFSDPGDYEVSVLAALSPNSCDQQETITFSVSVVETVGEIIGSSSACPEVEELLYSYKSSQAFSKVEFFPVGGDIVESTDASVVINWGVANPNAYLEAIPYSENGCPGDPIIFSVVVNEQLEAEPIQGPSQVCFDSNVVHFYAVPQPSAGRNYEWTVSGGQLIGGQGSGEIEVIWDEPDMEGIVSYEVSSLVDESCQGVSEPLRVRVEDEFNLTAAQVTAVACFGTATGEIRLAIEGGVAPFTFDWSHDSALDDVIAENLAAGTYSVRVTDQLGCERLLENLEISEPEVLSISEIAPISVSCFGKPDGQLDLEIAGGMAPYTINLDGGLQFSSTLNLSGLSQGDYDLEVVDANGCILPIQFQIGSPPPLEVDVRLQQAACPGGDNGELIAMTMASGGPFIYEWQGESSSNNELIAVPKGNYEVFVTDQQGCVSIGIGEVKEAAPEVRFPTGFYPDRDGDFFQAVSNCELEFEIWIYNRWGELIYSGTEGWDGMISGVDAPTGTYSYTVQYSYVLEEQVITENKSGAFALLR